MSLIVLVSSINVKPLLLCCKRERIDVWRWCTTRCRWCITCRYLEERLVGQYPSAEYFKYPSADFFKYPSAKYFKYPSADYFKYPSAKYFKYPSADYFKYPSAKYFKYPSVDYFSKIPLQASQRQEIRQGREEELDSPKIVSKRIKMEFLKRGRTQITSKIYSRLILILSIPDIRFSWIEYRVSGILNKWNKRKKDMSNMLQVYRSSNQLIHSQNQPSIFSCSGQLNRWPCHSLSEWVSEWVRFWFSRH